MGDSAEDMAEETGTRSLIRADHGSRTCDNDETIEDHAERCDAKDDSCDNDVDLPKVARKCTTEKQQGNLQHQR